MNAMQQPGGDMSDKIDVLAVMHEAAEAAAVGDFEGQAADLLDARAAVAKLIATVQRVAFNIEHIQPLDENARRFAVEDLRAALARIGGAA